MTWYADSPFTLCRMSWVKCRPRHFQRTLAPCLLPKIKVSAQKSSSPNRPQIHLKSNPWEMHLPAGTWRGPQRSLWCGTSCWDQKTTSAIDAAWSRSNPKKLASVSVSTRWVARKNVMWDPSLSSDKWECISKTKWTLILYQRERGLPPSTPPSGCSLINA